nr:uncharacterized protein LOC117606210 isoform X1 [Osmia lignaria]XP_034184298.1 uncharacterized protein LOC117606210 isoform X1 [Osmia lignaria]XP_034184299.1 uncharacterized protein LOC117606210 isoform X1 [Osmia lignaria]XP_034184300.1 uncharacterized protein LOC117606210 isoform X1 [Osmia lignaria]XP_034184301.1 uncharacterized protein LOC117606210 isoform X1 [Osmia lignaria]XP_034184302.1 uncharacterized protein LOC117606210 isoform X1 [Osmia lignaria]
MEKRSISGKDILRMDGLLPPTRRVPVCNAVTSTDKRKEKKWSLGGILKRISSMRDYDSSSNDEEIVYCTREPRPRNVFNRKSHSNVILHPVEKNSEQSFNNHDNQDNQDNDSIAKLLDTSSLQRDSMHRSSDGSLDGLSKKARKSKLKARIEAKRDRICADSSSDEESRKSCNSLTRYQNENGTHSMQKNSSCNRKSRAARTERYIKRLSRDEGHRLPENLNNIGNKRNSLELVNERSSVATDAYELLQSQAQSQSFINHSNSNTFPVQRSVENLRQSGIAASNFQTKSSTDLTKHHKSQYITDLNQNNTYAKPNVLQKNKNHVNYDENLFNSPSISKNYAEPYSCTKNRQFINQSSCPPEPPPRDPRFRAFSYGCNSFPLNGKYRVTGHDDTLRMKMNDIHQVTKDHLKGLRSYDSSNEINWSGSIRQCPRRPLSLTVSSTQSCNLTECTNNRHNSTGKHVDEPILYETEAMKCQRRNDRNDQLNSRFNDYHVKTGRSNLSTAAQNIPKNSASPTFNKISDSSRIKSPTKRILREDSYDLPNELPVVNVRTKEKEEQQRATEQETVERRRSSKNLEEALSELEAIYNSLRLGDEDLLDRAERRSMEEFSLRQAKTSNTVPFISEDSSDRSKDDMAYRRMHPKERPTSLSETVGQSALSNISYLIASPVLTRKDTTDSYAYTSNYPARRDEPDVTRDDVVYRSIHRANNTLKVIDPQPPFGIPLGPVTTAPESDYLHTTPTKPDHPRSLYIPQCEPDIVTDDLAFRTLRKDANTAKHSVENKNGPAPEQDTVFGTKKKRAVRSLSANLYGLINHNGIHLRREPSLQEITDQISDPVIDLGSLPERSACFRRVVSDGELSDYDTRWRTECSLKGSKTDINGNHSVSNLHRKKLRVYVAPSTQVQSCNEKNGEVGAKTLIPSNDMLSKSLNNEFWQDRVQSKSNDSLSKDTDSDFTAYSRLCQDLVNLIEGPNDTEAKAIDRSKQSTERDASHEKKSTMNESPILRIQSLGSQYAEDNEETVKESRAKDDVEKLTESLTNPENEDSKKTDDSAFDFYLRVADENVKLIAEAFSSVADHLRDSRLSQKNSLTSLRSEIETDSTAPNTSTRSSVTYSPDDDSFGASKTTDTLSIVPKEDVTITLKEDHLNVEREEDKNDPELDLSKAVHDLQLAAASLCEHEKEIEELEAVLRKDSTSSISDKIAIDQDKCQLIVEKSSMSVNEKKEQDQDRKTTVLPTDVKLRSDERDPNCEGESIECKNVYESYDIDIVRSTEMRISYVTNLITVMITTYSMVLLACFLALLLATVAVS